MKEYKATLYYGGLESLATAIIMQAVTDYTQALKTIASFDDCSPNERKMFAVIKQQALKEAQKNLEVNPVETYEERLAVCTKTLIERRKKDAQAEIELDERFFTGEWFAWLSDYDGEVIMNEIKRQVREWQKN